MAEFSLSVRAQRDLRDIFLYGYKQFGERQAEHYAARLKDVFDLLARHPRMGRMSPSIGANIRRHEHGAHVILYEDMGPSVRAIG